MWDLNGHLDEHLDGGWLIKWTGLGLQCQTPVW